MTPRCSFNCVVPSVSDSDAVVLQVSNEASTLLAEMTDFDAVATGDNLDDLSTNVAAVSCLSC